jgi:hypothetical protein
MEQWLVVKKVSLLELQQVETMESLMDSMKADTMED